MGCESSICRRHRRWCGAAMTWLLAVVMSSLVRKDWRISVNI